MTLLDHLKERGERVDDFADRIGEPVSTIRKIAYRQRQPSLPLAVKIERATEGGVTTADLLLGSDHHDAAGTTCREGSSFGKADKISGRVVA